MNMMNLKSYLGFFMAFLFSLAVGAAPKINESAPNFSVKDAKGKTHSLADYKGKWLVLEWYNKDCPFVVKHYDSKNMQNIQGRFADKDVKWLQVISSAEGTQGYLKPDEAAAVAKEAGTRAHATLLDTDGVMGRAYDARTTPHMFVVNPEGVLVYMGAIDDNRSANPNVIPKSKNYVVAALEAGMAGESIDPNSTRPYGCSVKYK